MGNEIELRLECVKLASGVSQYEDKDLFDIADKIYNYVTKEGDVTFDSLKKKNAEETIDRLFGLIPLIEGFISVFSENNEADNLEKEKEEIA